MSDTCGLTVKTWAVIPSKDWIVPFLDHISVYIATFLVLCNFAAIFPFTSIRSTSYLGLPDMVSNTMDRAVIGHEILHILQYITSSYKSSKFVGYVIVPCMSSFCMV